MLAELGHSLLCLCVFVSLGLSACIFRSENHNNATLAHRLSISLFILISLSFSTLFYSYIISDFSVVNVYQNSHSLQPMLYKITGTWGNHEGSMMLWLWLLCGYGFAFAKWQKESSLTTATLGFIGLIAFGFILFILCTSNPFIRLIPPPVEGKSLNPLLQDIGLAIHPPMLYLGYVGFSVVSAFAVAALWTRTPIDTMWAKQIKPWAMLSFSFLTAGIGLGSWWAYRELGWGGWWGWDPVENVSLLPWLTGTALVHCLLILCKRDSLQNWTLLLAIFTFAFSLSGTFLVRSGLLTSVHSFAVDPDRGLFVLAFISILIGGSFWLYAVRFPQPKAPDFSFFSRDGGILLNNLLLITLCITIFLGVFYPIALQVLNLHSVSVGAPYYNAVVPPLSIILLLLSAYFPFVAWKKGTFQTTMRPTLHTLCILVPVIALILWLQEEHLSSFKASITSVILGLSGAILFSASCAYLWRQMRKSNGLKADELATAFSHGGLAILVIAACFASTSRMEFERILHVGETVQFDDYNITLASLEQEEIANYVSEKAVLNVSRGKDSFTLIPQTRFYPTRGMETAESSIRMSASQDIYTAIAAINTSLQMKDQIFLRFYLIPGAFFLWLGFLFTFLGGIIGAKEGFKITTINQGKKPE